MNLKPLSFSLLLFIVLLSACSSKNLPTGERDDHFEHFNRKMWNFNYTIVDPYIVQPASKVWRIVPLPIRKGLVNIMHTTDEPIYSVNALLQGRMKDAVINTTKFWINAIYGLGGLIDVAGYQNNLRVENQDHLGHTLGKYGMPTGPFFMLPFYGPATPRQEIGYMIDLKYPVMSLVSLPGTLIKAGIEMLDSTEQLDQQRDILKSSQDPYITVREAYLQNLDKRTNQNQKVLKETLDNKVINDID